jgi:tRNA(fMet)-specific endonuclease VapC
LKYLLDTDHISILQRRSGPEFLALSARIALHQPADFAFSIVSFHEQVLGAQTFIARARSTKDSIRGYTLLTEILLAFSASPVLPFDAIAGGEFDRLRARNLRIATMDLRIAAITLARSLVLLTRNTKDFSRVPGLTIEDWTL